MISFPVRLITAKKIPAITTAASSRHASSTYNEFSLALMFSKPVPLSPHCQNQLWILRIFFYLYTQSPDMYHHRGIAVIKVRLVPDAFIQVLAENILPGYFISSRRILYSISENSTFSPFTVTSLNSSLSRIPASSM